MMAYMKSLTQFDKDGTDTDIIPMHQIIAGPLNVILIPSKVKEKSKNFR